MSKKNIIIYGATGAIGESSLNLIRDNIDNFNVIGLTCNSKIKHLIKIATEFNCKNIGIGNKDLIINHKDELANFNVYYGIDEFFSIVSENNVDIIIFAISGIAPIRLLMQLASSGCIIGLVNKECIICLGKLFINKANLFSTKIIPLDSEHNAIYQLIKNKNLDSVCKYTITASGGNYYNYSYSDLKKITPEQATIHPKWNMGKKITVDSSNLMNKGLEIIEASILFNINENDIDAIIHPESIIHGIITFIDSSSHAFLSHPNMEISISSALFEHNNVDLSKFNLNLDKIGALNFSKIDNMKFNSIDLSINALKIGGLMPTVLNYINEIMVYKFLDNEILFTDILIYNEKYMNLFISDNNNISVPDIADVFDTFKIIDEYMIKF